MRGVRDDMRWLPYVPDDGEAHVTPSVAVALRTVHDAVELLEAAVADTEPAPVSIVLLRADGGKVHRAARIEGIAGYMTYEGDNLDQSDLRVIPDLSKVSDDLDLCRRCFGVLDDVMATEEPN